MKVGILQFWRGCYAAAALLLVYGSIGKDPCYSPSSSLDARFMRNDPRHANQEKAMLGTARTCLHCMLRVTEGRLEPKPTAYLHKRGDRRR
jgi:hypothetical protein